MSVEAVEVARIKRLAIAKTVDLEHLSSRSHWKDVQEKLLGLMACDRTKTDTGRRDEKS